MKQFINIGLITLTTGISNFLEGNLLSSSLTFQLKDDTANFIQQVPNFQENLFILKN